MINQQKDYNILSNFQIEKKRPIRIVGEGDKIKAALAVDVFLIGQFCALSFLYDVDGTKGRTYILDTDDDSIVFKTSLWRVRAVFPPHFFLGTDLNDFRDEIVLFSVRNLVVKKSFSSHMSPINHISFYDDREFISVSDGGKMMFWDVDDTTEKQTLISSEICNPLLFVHPFKTNEEEGKEYELFLLTVNGFSNSTNNKGKQLRCFSSIWNVKEKRIVKRNFITDNNFVKGFHYRLRGVDACVLLFRPIPQLEENDEEIKGFLSSSDFDCHIYLVDLENFQVTNKISIPSSFGNENRLMDITPYDTGSFLLLFSSSTRKESEIKRMYIPSEKIVSVCFLSPPLSSQFSEEKESSKDKNLFAVGFQKHPFKRNVLMIGCSDTTFTKLMLKKQLDSTTQVDLSERMEFIKNDFKSLFLLDSEFSKFNIQLSLCSCEYNIPKSFLL